LETENVFFNEKEAVTGSELEEVEERFGFRFPPALRNHFLLHNGGEPRRHVLRLGERLLVVHAFLPVKHGPKGCLFEDTCRRLRVERKVFPEHLVPFAVDPGGDYFCFSVRNEDEGAIYHFIGEYLPDEDRAVTRLSGSLPEFLELLEEGDF